MFCGRIPWHSPYIGLIYSTLRTGHYLQAKNKCMRVVSNSFWIHLQTSSPQQSRWMNLGQFKIEVVVWTGQGIQQCLFISIQIHTYPYISHIHTYPYIISIHNIIYIYISMYISHLVWCFNIFKCWHQKHPDALLIIVPSHLQRRSFAEQWLRKAGAVFRGLLKAVTSAYVHNLCVYIYIILYYIYVYTYLHVAYVIHIYMYIYSNIMSICI